MDFIENAFKFKQDGGSEHFDPDDLEDDFKTNCPGYDKLPHILPATRRVIVIGDLHGDVSKALKCLLAAKVINRKQKWIGEDTIVVQVGDQLDGCRPKHMGDTCKDDKKVDYADIRVMDIMDRFHRKAQKHGGAVYSLLGNHEMMQTEPNSYISPNSYAYFNNYVDPKTGKKFSDGRTARIHAFQPGNEYAKRLACTRQTALIIGSNLFVHAGILPRLAKKVSVKQLNLIVRKWLLGQIRSDEDVKGIGSVNDIISNYNISPFWPRFFGNMPANKPMSHQVCKNKLKPTLQVYEINGMVVGHTPQFMHNKGINGTCDKKLWRVDVGMSDAFKKFSSKRADKLRKVQVLEIKNDKKFRIIAEV